MLREKEVHKDHAKIISGTTFSYQRKAIARLNGKHFDEDKRKLYTSLRVAGTSCGPSYCEKHEKEKGVNATWKYLV